MRRYTPAFTVLAAGLLLAGCGQGTDTATTSPAAGDTTPATTSASPAGTGTSAPAVSDADHNQAALTAIGTAEQAAGGTAYEIDDEDDDNTWEVDVWANGRSVEVDVSADGRTVNRQDDDDDDRDGSRVTGVQTSLPQAIERALQEVPGRLDDAELEEENRALVWEVSIDTDRDDDIEVYISTTDGSVVRVDR